MSSERYGVPALLSFLIPGLGQVVKHQMSRGLAAFAAVVLAITVGTGGVSTAMANTLPAPALDVVALAASALLYITAAAVWVWGIVDAYNNPAS